MALSTQSGFSVPGGGPTWLQDDTAGDLVPVAGGSPIDMVRGIGRQSANVLGSSSTAAGRMLTNQLLPTCIAMVQTVPGAENNTFTTRRAIQGTLINTFNLAASQTAGTFPAGALNLLGRTIRISGGGTMGTNLTPNFTFDFALGATVVATTGSLAINAAITTPANFNFSIIATVTTTGSSGVVVSTGQFNFASATNVTNTWPIANTTPGTGATVNLTAAQAVTFNATCGASDAANRVRLFNFLVEILY